MGIRTKLFSLRHAKKKTSNSAVVEKSNLTVLSEEEIYALLSLDFTKNSPHTAQALALSSSKSTPRGRRKGLSSLINRGLISLDNDKVSTQGEASNIVRALNHPSEWTSFRFVSGDIGEEIRSVTVGVMLSGESESLITMKSPAGWTFSPLANSVVDSLQDLFTAYLLNTAKDSNLFIATVNHHTLSDDKDITVRRLMGKWTVTINDEEKEVPDMFDALHLIRDEIS